MPAKLHSFPPKLRAWDVYARLSRNTTPTELQYVRDFENVRLLQHGQEVELKLSKAVIANDGAAAKSCVRGFEELLDHGSLICVRKPDDTLVFQESDFKCFTALMPTRVRNESFPDFFAASEKPGEKRFSRVFSKKLLCWDPAKIGREPIQCCCNPAVTLSPEFANTQMA